MRESKIALIFTAESTTDVCFTSCFCDCLTASIVISLRRLNACCSTVSTADNSTHSYLFLQSKAAQWIVVILRLARQKHILDDGKMRKNNRIGIFHPKNSDHVICTSGIYGRIGNIPIHPEEAIDANSH